MLCYSKMNRQMIAAQLDVVVSEAC
jgi:hypothetical protein